MTTRPLRSPFRVAGLAAALVLAGAAWAAPRMLVDAAGTEFDLADLRDGETRTFGAGDAQLTAERDGDVVTVRREARGEHGPLSLRCRLSTDGCSVVTFEGDDRVALQVEKRRECVNGVGDCEADEEEIVLGAHDGTHEVIVERCEGAACSERVWIGAADAGANVFVLSEPGGGFHFAGGDRSVLRCPEGDTTMVVERAEADGTFLCPKHSTRLEPLAATDRPRVLRKVRVQDDGGAQ
jgi:hypothetical protein